MRKWNVSWNGDDTATAQALAQAMADTYELSHPAIRDWYLKTMKDLDNLDRAQRAVKALIQEPFVIATHGYSEQDRNAYHEHSWQMLKEAVGLTESFCAVCGQWYPPGTHTCQ